MLGPGAIVGELAIIDGGRDQRRCSRSDCELSFISRAIFKERTIRHPEIYQYVINVLARRLRRTDEAMAATSFLTVKARLARAGARGGAGALRANPIFSTPTRATSLPPQPSRAC
jgi:CRP/FNR family transcriptional regulator